MAQVQIALLGGVEARLPTGQLLVVSGQTAPALLAYLSARPGRSHTREALCALLWPDVPAAQARHRLRQTLLILRRTLAPAGPSCFLNTGEEIAVDRDRIKVDVVAFEQALAEATPEALGRAAALYRGDFLAGLREQAGPFEEWLLSERERLRELAQETLARLLAHHEATGAVDAAIQTGVRLLALDPVQEPVHRALMRLYARQGRRGAALRQYQNCVAALRRDLGVEPEAETRQLYRMLLRERPEPRGATGAPKAATPSDVADALVGGAETPFVGREVERNRLRHDLDAAWSGSGGIAIVRGEAGIGKSRLAAEAIRDALARGGRVVLGRAHETQRILPFGAWIEALRAAGVPDAIGRETPPAVRRELARLFPELGSAPPPTFQDYGRLFEALVIPFAELGQRQPLLVVIEDLQWADEMTLRFLAFLSRRLRGRRVLILATLRDEEVATAPILAAVLEELQREPRTVIIRLAPLSREHMDALVAALMPAGGSADRARLLERLWRTSEGNPFVLEELVRAIREGVVPGDAPTLPLPERVREAITHRLGRLGERERHVLGAAAVIGREAGFRLLQRVAGLAERDVAEATEQLVARGVLHAVGDRLDFVHDRVREVAYGRLLPARRAALHEAAGHALEELYADRLDQVADRLAHHYAHTDEAAKTVEYLVRFAAVAARRHAHADAVTALRGALTRVHGLPAAEREPRLAHVAVALAQSLFYLGRFRDGLDVLQGQRALVEQLDDPWRTGPFFWMLGRAQNYLGDRDGAAESAQQALRAATTCGDEATMGKALYLLSNEAHSLGRPREGIEHGLRAVSLLTRVGDHYWRGLSEAIVGINYLTIGEFGAALDAEGRARAAGQAIGSPRLQSFAACITGWILATRGDAVDGVEACQEALELAPDPYSRALAMGDLGYAWLQQGDAIRAIGMLEEALRQVAEFGLLRVHSEFAVWLGEAYLAADRIQDARRSARDGLGIAHRDRALLVVGWALRALGATARAEGVLSEAHALLSDALDTFGSIQACFEVARTRLELALLAQAAGDTATATRHLTEARDVFLHLRVPVYAERTLALAAKLGLPLCAPGGLIDSLG